MKKASALVSSHFFFPVFQLDQNQKSLEGSRLEDIGRTGKTEAHQLPICLGNVTEAEKILGRTNIYCHDVICQDPRQNSKGHSMSLPGSLPF